MHSIHRRMMTTYHSNMAPMENRLSTMVVEMIRHIFDNHEIDVTKTKRRFEPIVISRAALFNACRGLMTSTQLGGHFGMNHATVLHHQKNHDSLLMMTYYRRLYFELMKIRSNYDERQKEFDNDLTRQLETLRAEYDMLLWKYEQLKSEREHEEIDS